MGHYVYKYVLNGEILYIGKCDAQLETRLAQHGKTGDNIPSEAWEELKQADVFYTQLANSIMSDVVESELIRRHKPKYNKAKTSDWSGLDFSEPSWVKYDASSKPANSRPQNRSRSPRKQDEQDREICFINRMFRNRTSRYGDDESLGLFPPMRLIVLDDFDYKMLKQDVQTLEWFTYVLHHKMVLYPIPNIYLSWFDGVVFGSIRTLVRTLKRDALMKLQVAMWVDSFRIREKLHCVDIESSGDWSDRIVQLFKDINFSFDVVHNSVDARGYAEVVLPMIRSTEYMACLDEVQRRE